MPYTTFWCIILLLNYCLTISKITKKWRKCGGGGTTYDGASLQYDQISFKVLNQVRAGLKFKKVDSHSSAPLKYAQFKMCKAKP
ncbi:MAG: hypothetical protein LBP35_05430 [Candidatus Ancillula trichonymphae]|nr:hypothetical protein [Candidatus Ancillula trichonymphae]